MPADTEAQIGSLTSTVSHLIDHPQLCPINILSNDRFQLRCNSPRESPPLELATWGETLTAPRVDVQLIHADYDDQLHAFVYVVGQIDERTVSVWDVVPGLVDSLTPEAFDATGYVQITVDALRAFAEHGTAPEPVRETAPA